MRETSPGRRARVSAARRDLLSAAKYGLPHVAQHKTSHLALLHFCQVEFQRLGDVSDNLIRRISSQIEARHGADEAEGQILDAIKGFADLLLHIVRYCLSVKKRIVGNGWRRPDHLDLAAVDCLFVASTGIDPVGYGGGVNLALGHC